MLPGQAAHRTACVREILGKSAHLCCPHDRHARGTDELGRQTCPKETADALMAKVDSALDLAAQVEAMQRDLDARATEAKVRWPGACASRELPRQRQGGPYCIAAEDGLCPS
jgi:hypothetical protein